MKNTAIHLFAALCTTLSSATTQQAQAPDQRLLPATLMANSSMPFGATQIAADLVQAEGRSFQATFDRQVIAIETPGSGITHGNSAAPRLELRYLGSRRGNEHHAAPQPSNPRLNDQVVRYHRGNVVETYTVSATGYEQSFHISQQPTGYGDLVLAIAASGNVTAAAVRSAHQALEFSQAGVRAIRYGEATAFDRSGLRVDVLTSYDGLGRIELTVPHSFLAEATYPIVVDPAVGPVFIASSAVWQDSNPDVAYDLVNDTYMLVWRRTLTTTNGIRAQLFDGDGVALTSYFVLATGVDYGQVSIALCNSLNQNAFLVVWQQAGTIQGQLRSTTTGLSVASPFAISSPGAGQSDDRPTVSGPGDGAMMVAWERTLAGATQAQGVRMRELYFPNPNSASTVSIGPERDIQTLTSGYVRNVRLARSDVRTTVGGQAWYINRLAWDRWWTSPSPGDWDVYSCSFRVKPNPFDFVIIDAVGTVPGANSIGDNEFNCDIGSRADLHQTGAGLQYCLAWQDEGDVMAQMYDANATVGVNITVDASPDFEGQPAVGAGFCEFTIGYSRIVPPAEFDVDIFAARVLLDGTVAINRRLIDDPGGNFQAHLAASSRPIHTSTQMPTNTSLLTWFGSTGPVSGINDVRARFFEPVTPSTSLFGSACPGPLGELASIGTAGGDPIAGNDAFDFTVSGAPSNSLAALVISDGFTNIPIPGAPGCNLYAGLPFITVLATVTDATGFGSVDLPLPCSIPHTATLAFQWGIYTPGHNAFGWIVSNDMDIYWSHL